MNKAEAIQALQKGKKLTHPYFHTKDFIFMIGNEIHSGQGTNHGTSFWEGRIGDIFDKDWNIFEESNSNTEPEEPTLDEKVRIDMLAERIKLLFGFCVELIPDIDLLERTANNAGQRESMAMSAAPLLGAAGIDYEEKNAEWALRRKRAEALANLLKVLRDTENDRISMQEKSASMQVHRNEIARLFGI